MTTSYCLQPVHVCPCDQCDLRRREQVRSFAESWFEQRTWELLRRQAEERIEREEAFGLEESGIRPTVRPTRGTRRGAQTRPMKRVRHNHG